MRILIQMSLLVNQLKQGVEFLYPDTAPFQEACAPLHQEVIGGNATLEGIYAKIQEYNEMYRTAE